MKSNATRLFTSIAGSIGLATAAMLPAATPAAAQSTAVASTMDSETQTLIQFAISQGQRDLAVVSKANARLYLVENGRVTLDVPVGLGENRNAGAIAGMETRKGTPEGRFGIRIAADSNALSISGMPVVDFVCTPNGRFCMSMHATFLGAFNARQARINSPQVSDNFFSNGCINVRPEDMRVVLNFFQTHDAGNNEHVHPYLYVMPTDASRTRAMFGIPANFGTTSPANPTVSAP